MFVRVGGWFRGKVSRRGFSSRKQKATGLNLVSNGNSKPKVTSGGVAGLSPRAMIPTLPGRRRRKRPR